MLRRAKEIPLDPICETLVLFPVWGLVLIVSVSNRIPDDWRLSRNGLNWGEHAVTLLMQIAT